MMTSLMPAFRQKTSALFMTTFDEFYLNKTSSWVELAISSRSFDVLDMSIHQSSWNFILETITHYEQQLTFQFLDVY